ncbi:hypothetical protein V8E53_009077 [Lactarius tabidus]
MRTFLFTMLVTVASVVTPSLSAPLGYMVLLLVECSRFDVRRFDLIMTNSLSVNLWHINLNNIPSTAFSVLVNPPSCNTAFIDLSPRGARFNNRNSRTHGYSLELPQEADDFGKGQRILGAIMWPFGAKTAGVPVPFYPPAQSSESTSGGGGGAMLSAADYGLKYGQEALLGSFRPLRKFCTVAIGGAAAREFVQLLEVHQPSDHLEGDFGIESNRELAKDESIEFPVAQRKLSCFCTAAESGYKDQGGKEKGI